MSTKVKVRVLVAIAAAILLIRVFFSSSGEAAVLHVMAADEDSRISYNYDSGALFYSYNSRDFFFSTKDSVKLMSSRGEVHWEDIISLTAPILYGKSDVVAIGEARGHTIYVFNTLGRIMEQRFDAPIQRFSVNKSGYLTVILQTASGYRIEAYRPGRENFIWQYNIITPNLFPISADTSPDGRIAAVSMLNLTPDARHSMTTEILFMYTNQADALTVEGADGIFAGKTLHDQLAQISFMDNRLLVVTDRQIIAFSFNNNDDVILDWELPLRNRISQFSTYGESGFAFVTGEPFSEFYDEGQAVGELLFYNMNGRSTGSFHFGSEADYLSMNMGGAIVGNGRNFSAVSNRGSLLWEYSSPMDLSQFIFIDNVNTALKAGLSHALIIRRST